MRPEFLGILIPLAALSIPVIRILTRHQAQMAQIIHGQSQNQGNSQETAQLRDEVRQLRELMHQQTIALDNLRDDVKAASVGSVQARLTENS